MFELFLVSIIWGFSFVIIKGKLTGLDPFFLAFVRLFIGSLVFLPFFKIKFFKYLSREIIFIGVIQYGLMYIFYINSFQYLQVSQLALMTIFTPLFVYVLGEFFEKKFSVFLLMIVALNILSSSILIDIRVPGKLKGIILIQLSNICFAFGQTYYKYKLSKKIPKGVKQHQVYSVIYFISAIATLPFLLMKSKILLNMDLSSTQVIYLIYLGIVPTGLGFYFWNKGAVKVSHTFLAIANNLKIPSALIFSILLLKEEINLSAISIFLLVFSLSVIFLTFKKYTNLSENNLELRS